MAQPGTTFDKGHIYHSQLCGISPVRLMFTGAVKHRPAELTTFYFKVEGDTEGEYGVKAENDEYEAVLAAAPRKIWMTVHFEGNAKDGEATVRLSDAEAAPRPVPQNGNGGTSRPASQPLAGIPWSSMEERYGRALRAAERLVTNSAYLAPDDVRTIAATLCIGQMDIMRQMNALVPLENGIATEPVTDSEDTDTVSAPAPVREADPNAATPEEMAGLRAAYDAVKFHVPAKERKGIEKLIADGTTMERATKASIYLAGVSEQVREKEEAAKAQEPAAKQESLAIPGPSMGAEDDLPF